MSNDITQDRLKELLVYDPYSGIFIRKVTRGGSQAGTVAGTLHHSGYLQMMVDGKTYLAQRLAYLYMTGEFPPEEMDHENRVKSDNRWDNLRAVTSIENNRNMPLQKSNMSGCVGVHWNTNAARWIASIKINKKRVSLGSFVDFDDAVAARQESNVRYGFHKNHGRAA